MAMDTVKKNDINLSFQLQKFKNWHKLLKRLKSIVRQSDFYLNRETDTNK